MNLLLQVTASYMKMISSYVMQDDQLFPMLSVFETFMFAAEVRLPSSISRKEKRNRVHELIEQLGLQVLTLVFSSLSTMETKAKVMELFCFVECKAYKYR